MFSAQMDRPKSAPSAHKPMSSMHMGRVRAHSSIEIYLPGSGLFSNQSNGAYYETVDPPIQFKLSQIAGVDKCEDLQFLYTHGHLTLSLVSSNKVLEVGAGAGRVVDWLAQHCKYFHVTAVERSLQFVQELYKKKSILRAILQSRAEVVADDIFNFSISSSGKKYYRIFWLWCGISDFTLLQQSHLIHCFSQMLTYDGQLIIETAQINEKKLAISADTYGSSHDEMPGTFYTVTNESLSKLGAIQKDGRPLKLHGYVPTAAEIKEIASQHNLRCEQKIYTAYNGRVRNLFILSRQ